MDETEEELFLTAELYTSFLKEIGEELMFDGPYRIKKYEENEFIETMEAEYNTAEELVNDLFDEECVSVYIKPMSKIKQRLFFWRSKITEIGYTVGETNRTKISYEVHSVE